MAEARGVTGRGEIQQVTTLCPESVKHLVLRKNEPGRTGSILSEITCKQEMLRKLKWLSLVLAKSIIILFQFEFIVSLYDNKWSKCFRHGANMAVQKRANL